MKTFTVHARAYVRFFGMSFIANLSSAMAYRWNFILQVLGMMINNAAFAVFWRILLDRTGDLGGYGFKDVLFIWALTSSAFGLAHVVFGNLRNISELVKQGDLDTYLGQPKNVLFNVLISKTDVSAWGDFLYGFVVFAFLGTDFFGWLGFVLFVLCGAMIFSGTFIIAESLSFWLGGSTGLSQTIAELLLSFSLYPESIFPKQMRWIFYSLIPSGFVVFLPRSLWTSPNLAFGAMVVGAALLYMCLGFCIFARGLQRYESGNRVGARL